MNHHAQRLLVAASRGARVQNKHSLLRQCWVDSDDVYLDGFVNSQRIHPDDIACQYGPIATELRKKGSDLSAGLSSLAMSWLDYATEFQFVWIFKPSSHLSWLCLFAAELAADEGM